MRDLGKKGCFLGEQMTCDKCGQTQQSDPRYTSGWWKVAVNAHEVHLCPRCAGSSDPQCTQCGRFYDRHTYQACPWCKESTQ